MKLIFCQKNKKKMQALPKAPFPGKDGEYILANVSAQAWQYWLDEQTRLINELQLNPLDSNTRDFLRRQMFNFINNRPYETAQGYKPLDTSN